MRSPLSIAIGLMVCFFTTVCFAQGGKIIPGEVWPDDRGQHIQAHGGGILKYKDEYYWFGEDRTRDLDRNLRAVACYSSTDLVHWKFRNRVFQMAAVGNAQPPATTRPADFPGQALIVERPKVFHNAKTGKFVMYMHLDGPASNGRGQ